LLGLKSGYQRSGACQASFRPLMGSLILLFIYELILGITAGDLVEGLS
jgi:hypothetical protein